MTPVVAAVMRELDASARGKRSWEEDAIAIITAVLDNLDREAMAKVAYEAAGNKTPWDTTRDEYRRGVTDCIDAALAAVRPCPAGGEDI